MRFANLKTATILVAGLVMPVLAVAQAPQSNQLDFGSPAPELKVKWIKGTPIGKWDPEKLYVVEFWATWCGPCRENMPHLSELARKNAGKVEVIGVNVWEKVPAGKPYEDCHPKVEAFVKNMGNSMDYHVALDLNGQPMAKNWLAAAGESGIPVAFIVKAGKIVWKGHPQGLEKTLESIAAGTYDMSKFAKESRAKAAEAAKAMEPLRILSETVNAAMAAKDYAKALAAIDQAEAVIDPKQKMILCFGRLNVLLKSDPEKAMAYARSLGPDLKPFEMTFAAAIAMEDGLPKDAYAFSASVLGPAATKPIGNPSLLNHTLALALIKVGDPKGAVEAEERAVAAAKEALASGSSKGVINPSVVEEYERCLARYRDQAAKAGAK